MSREAAIKKLKIASAKLDLASERFNKAFENWRTAKLAASRKPVSSLGTGVDGARALHPDVVRDLSRLDGEPPSMAHICDLPHGEN